LVKIAICFLSAFSFLYVPKRIILWKLEHWTSDRPRPAGTERHEMRKVYPQFQARSHWIRPLPSHALIHRTVTESRLEEEK
jgi:hypothetical protein